MTEDAIGLVVLAGEVGLISIVARNLEIPLWGWVFAFAALAILALSLWHGEKWPKGSRDVLKQVFGSVLMGSIFFVIDLVIGHFLHPELALIQAAESGKSFFGIAITVLVCPIVTTVLLAGYFRSVFLEETAQRS